MPRTKNAENTAGRLRNIRLALDYPQEAMARTLGVAQSNYSAYERGDSELNLHKAQILFRNFRVNPMYLVLGHEPMFLPAPEVSDDPMRAALSMLGNLATAASHHVRETQARQAIASLLEQAYGLHEAIQAEQREIASLSDFYQALSNRYAALLVLLTDRLGSAPKEGKPAPPMP